MTDKSFKFALKTHNVPTKNAHHFDVAGSRTDRSLASFSKQIGAKPSVRLSSSPIPLKQRKKTIGGGTTTNSSQNNNNNNNHQHHQSTSVGPTGAIVQNSSSNNNIGLTSSSGTPSTTNFHYNQTAQNFNQSINNQQQQHHHHQGYSQFQNQHHHNHHHHHQIHIPSSSTTNTNLNKSGAGGGGGINSNSLLGHNNNHDEPSNSKIGGVGDPVTESMTARQIKLAKQLKAVKTENKRYMQLLKDSQRILNEKLTESKQQSEKIVGLFNKLWPALQGQINGISAQKLLQSLEGVMDAESAKTSASIATTQATSAKDQNQQPLIDSMNSGIKSNAVVLPSNSANSTAMTSSQFQTTLIEALQSQKSDFDKEKTYLLAQIAHLRSQRDTLITHFAQYSQNDKVSTMDRYQAALQLSQVAKSNKQNKRPPSARKTSGISPNNSSAKLAVASIRDSQDNIPSFLKATMGLRQRPNTSSLQLSHATANAQSISKQSSTNRILSTTKQGGSAFLQALAHCQQQSQLDDQKSNSSSSNNNIRKSRALGINNPSNTSSTISAGGGNGPMQHQNHHHHLHHHNNYHLQQHHHLHHHGASPVMQRGNSGVASENQMSPIQQRMMHYYHPLNKNGGGGGNSGMLGRSPKP